jgi:hypothetical protein
MPDVGRQKGKQVHVDSGSLSGEICSTFSPLSPGAGQRIWTRWQRADTRRVGRCPAIGKEQVGCGRAVSPPGGRTRSRRTALETVFRQARRGGVGLLRKRSSATQSATSIGRFSLWFLYKLLSSLLRVNRCNSEWHSFVCPIGYAALFILRLVRA